ncbi:hypothetical protein AZI98_08845 [Aeribacillus pallidus]|uniref:Phage neck terminator protein gp12-like domain-containing protein n=1 Tax=Aeribacillus pallidus TaxID=33936 RepID=A0A165XLL6_9BACI|nr:hypothetical protein [Aeribacillus pallidus]KZN96161.1 hypothetical protein AZI98_08845 [Aeribacillus pallidus]
MIQKIKSIIVQAIEDIGMEIIPANTTKPKPPLPYATYNIIAPYIKERGKGNLSVYQDGDSTFLKRDEQYKITVSFNVYSEENESTIDWAIKLRQWFLFWGLDFIQEQNVAVVNVGNIENRTVFLIDSYEYKHGFDVQLRLTNEQIRTVEAIENIDLGGM